jgi:hypothetical protein
MFDAAREKIANLEYSWKNPAAYVVFVPGISLIVEKIKLADLKIPSFDSNKTIQDVTGFEEENKKLISLFRGHLIGSLSQMAISGLIVMSFAPSVFTAISLLALMVSTFEFAYTLYQSVTMTLGVTQKNGGFAIESALSALFDTV